MLISNRDPQTFKRGTSTMSCRLLEGCTIVFKKSMNNIIVSLGYSLRTVIDTEKRSQKIKRRSGVGKHGIHSTHLWMNRLLSRTSNRTKISRGQDKCPLWASCVRQAIVCRPLYHMTKCSSQHQGHASKITMRIDLILVKNGTHKNNNNKKLV